MNHEAERSEPAMAWWRRQLAGLEPALELPADRPRAPGVEPRLARLAAPVGGQGGCLEALDLVAARPSRDVDTAVLLAGVAALCGHLTGRRDLALGTSVSAPDGGSGLAVVRFRLAAGTSFGELLTQARERVGEAARRGPVPPGLASGYDGRHPLTQVVVTVRSRGEGAPDTSALRIAPEAPAFDLAWILDRAVEPATLLLEHDPVRFGSSGPVFLRRLQSLLAAGLDDPGAPVAALAAGSLPVA